jgi:hypothetical protein
VRKVPTLYVHSRNARALKLRKEMEDRVCLQAAQGDDPWLVFLTEEYVGRIFFLHDIAERHKLYRVRNIAYWTSINKTRFENLEATLEPIHLSPDGEFYVHDNDVVIEPKGIRHTFDEIKSSPRIYCSTIHRWRRQEANSYRLCRSLH